MNDQPLTIDLVEAIRSPVYRGEISRELDGVGEEFFFHEAADWIVMLQHALTQIAEWAEQADDAEAIAGRKKTGEIARRALGRLSEGAIEMALREAIGTLNVKEGE